MRAKYTAIIFATTCLTPAFAADLKGTSHVDAVTVYPSGAEISRVAEVHLPSGETTLILDALPGELDAQSLRVEGVGGSGLEIGSVDSKLIYASSGPIDAERAKLENEMEALTDERQAPCERQGLRCLIEVCPACAFVTEGDCWIGVGAAGAHLSFCNRNPGTGLSRNGILIEKLLDYRCFRPLLSRERRCANQ